MKTWRRFLSVFLTISMLLPMTAIGEDVESYLDAVIDSQESIVSVEPGNSEGSEDTVGIQDTVDDSSQVDDASEDSFQEEDIQAKNIESVPNEMVLDLSENGVEKSDEVSEANQEPVQKEVDFTAKKIELNMDKGTTLLIVPVNGTVQEAWSVPKAGKGNVTATLRADGVTVITAKNPVKKVKLSAKVLLSTGKTKKINMTLNVNDPNAPRAITLRGMPTGGVPVGRMLDLSQYIVLDPSSATLDSVEIKVSGSGKLDNSQYPYGMITTKKGSAKIAITSRSDKKVKMKPFSLKVLDNKTAKMTPKPGKADMPHGWTMWPVSLEVKGNILKCQFNVINGTDDKMAQIKNMTIKVAAGRWGNIIAEGTFANVKASVAKQKSKTVKFDLKINPQNMKDVFLPEAWANQTLHFLINQETVKLTGKKGESADFVYSKYFPEPGVDASISLDKAEATLTLGGEPLTLTATVVPADLTYTWSSSDENVATVANGVVTAVSPGTAVISAEAKDDSKVKATCTVSIVGESSPDPSIGLDRSEATLTVGGECLTLIATVFPANLSYRWFSNNESVATVVNGVVTAVAPGMAVITAELEDESKAHADCVVTVLPQQVIKVNSISLDKSAIALKIGEKNTITATVLPEDATNNLILWESSDSSIATVNDGVITGIKAGTTTINAISADDSGISANCNVIVSTASTVQAWDDFSEGLTDMIGQYEDSISVSDQDGEYATGRLIVKSVDGLPDISAFKPAAMIADPNGAYILQFTSDVDAAACAAYLNEQSGVDFAEPDGIVFADDANDSQVNSDAIGWGVSAIHADEYASYLIDNGKNREVIVAVVDNGIDPNHSMFKNRLVKGCNLIENDDSMIDDHGHGTHVAGTVVDCTPGLNIKIMPVRVMTKSRGYWSVAASGIQYAVNHGAEVINLSMGSSGHNNYIEKAIRDAVSKGVTVVASAGNQRADITNHCPSHLKECISVAAVNKDQKIASFSNYGNAIDIAAPGVDIRSAYPGGDYVSWDGTSMATPHVTAAAAMLKMSNSSLSPSQIESRLRKAATDLGPDGWDKDYGAGLLNMMPLMKVTQITLNISNAEIKPEETIELIASVLPANAFDKNVIWTSSDETVAAVDNGVVKGISEGTVIITAESADGSGIKATCTVTVVPVLVQSITLTPTEAMLKVGDTLEVSAAVLPEDATNKSLTWTSSDESVAIVTDGVVTAISDGTTTITAAAIDDTGMPSENTVSVKVYTERDSFKILNGVVIGYDGESGEITIPATYGNDKPVISIGESIFAGTTKITSVIVTSGIETIQARAFANCALSSITLPTSISFIDNTAFDGPEKVSITVEKGCYAYDWALAKGYISEAPYPESAHPYTENMDESWTYTHPKDAAMLAVTFTSMTNFEKDCDFLTITDSTGNSIKYSDNELAGITVMLPGNCFQLQLESDSSVQKYGFSITKIVAYTDAEYVEYLEDVKNHPFITRVLTNGTLEITGYRGAETEITIPSEIDGVLVTSIGYRAFKENSQITHLIISEGITGIGSSAFFGCNNLTNAIIPGTVSKIDSEAFRDCTTLATLTLGEGVQTINWLAFEDCDALTEITLPSSLKSVSESAFDDCDKLTTVHAEKNTYAYSWALEHGLIHPDSNLVTPIVYDGDVTETEEAIIWEHLSGDQAYLRLYINATEMPEYDYDFREDAEDPIGSISHKKHSDYFLMSIKLLKNRTGTVREVTINFNLDGYIVKPLTIRQQPYLVPAIITPDDLVECYGSDENIPKVYKSYEDIEFKWNTCDGAAGYTIGLDTPAIVRGSDGIGDFVRYDADDSALNVGIIPFTMSRDDMVPTGKIDHHIYMRVYDAYGHRYVSEYQFGIIDSSMADWGYQYIDDNAAITAYLGKEAYPIVPSDIDGHPVVLIDDYTFYENEIITGITLPDSLTEIGMGVFGNCVNLKSINIPKGVTVLGENTFENCISLTSIDIPEDVTELEEDLFYECTALKHVTLPDGLKTIGKAFYHCSALESIEIPNTVQSIGYHAFCGCNSLTDLVIPSSVEDIDWYAFDDCINLKNLTILGTKIYIGEGAFYGCSSLQTVSIFSENIDMYDYPFAFRNCDALSKIVFSKDVENINDINLHNFRALLNFEVSEENPVFCSIDGVLFNKDRTKLLCYPSARVGDYMVPEGVTEISDDAFAYCPYLTSVTVPAGAAIIGEHAFEGCVRLSTVTLPDSITEIKDNAFEDCYCGIVAPEGSYALEWATQQGFVKEDVVLESAHPYENNSDEEWTYTYDGEAEYIKVTFSKTTKFEDGHDYLTITNAEGNNSEYSGSELSGRILMLPGKTFKLNLHTDGSSTYFGFRITKVEAMTQAEYMAYQESHLFSNRILSNGTFEITGYEGNDTEFHDVVLPVEIDGVPVTSIKDNAFFYSANHWTSVTIPEGYTHIGKTIFGNCPYLTSVTIPDSATDISIDAFGFAPLSQINIGGNNPAYCMVDGVLFDSDQYSLMRCTVNKTGNYAIPSTVKVIAEGAFNECDSITKIIMPDSVNDIGALAFYDCSSLTSIRISENIISLPSQVFGGCVNLKNIDLPNGLIYIGDEAFQSCESLESIFIPASVTKINEGIFRDYANTKTVDVFEGCSSLREINVDSDNDNYCSYDGVLFNKDNSILICYPAMKSGHYVIPEGVTTIGPEAFSGCDGLTGITLPYGLKVIPNNAFSYCDNLNDIDIPESVTSIGGNAFCGCDALTSIVFPDGIGTIEGWTLSWCDNLESFTIPNNVTRIEEYAFAYSGKLKSVIVPPSVSSIGENAFFGCSSNLILFGESGSFIESYAVDNSIIFRDMYANPEVLPENIEISNAPDMMQHGSSVQLKWEVQPVNSDNNNVKWLSSAPTIVYVDSNGLLTAIGNGSATITATAEANGIKTSFNVQSIAKEKLAIGTPALRMRVAQKTYVSMDWSNVESNNGEKVYYAVERSYSKNGSYTVLESKTRQTQYIDTNINVSTTYYYRIRAYAIDSDTGEQVETVSRPKLATTPDSQGNGAIIDNSYDVPDNKFTKPEVTSVLVVPSTLSVAGDMQPSTSNTLVANLYPTGADSIVSWKSSNESVFKPLVQTDDQMIQYRTGHVTNPTSVTLTATANGKNGTASITVYDRPIVKVNGIDVANLSFQTFDLRSGDIKITWSNAQSNSEVVYTAIYTQEPDLATDGSGSEPGRLSSNYNHYYNGGKSLTIPASALVANQYIKVAVCSYGVSWSVIGIHVVDSYVPLTSLSIKEGHNIALRDYYDVNMTTLNLSIEPLNATSQSFIWSSDDSSIVKVTGNGRKASIVGLKAGSTVVHVTNPESNLTDYINVDIVDFDVDNTENYLMTYSDGTKRWVGTQDELSTITIHTSDNIRTLSVTGASAQMSSNGVFTFTGLQLAGGYHDGRNNSLQPFIATAITSNGSTLSEPYVFFVATPASENLQGKNVTLSQDTLLYNNPQNTNSVKASLKNGDIVTVLGEFTYIGKEWYMVSFNNILGVITNKAIDSKGNSIVSIFASDAILGPNDIYTMSWKQNSSFPKQGQLLVRVANIEYDKEIYVDRIEIENGVPMEGSHPNRILIGASYLPNGKYIAEINLLNEESTVISSDSCQFSITRKLDSKFDSIFAQPNSEENKLLLEQSAVMACAVYNKTECKNKLETLGFNTIRDYNYESGVNTVATMIGKKRIWDEDGNSVDLIAVIMRGTTGTLEWLSNFNIGTSGRHYGFDQAAKNVTSLVQRYMSTFNCGGENARIWITGHSRAAGVANLIAGDYAFNNLLFSRNNIYAYCFAVPNPILKTESVEYSWIHNYNIGGDLVPNVPTPGMGFSRFGRQPKVYNYTRNESESMYFVITTQDLNTPGTTKNVISKFSRIAISRNTVNLIYMKVKDYVDENKDSRELSEYDLFVSSVEILLYLSDIVTDPVNIDYILNNIPSVWIQDALDISEDAEIGKYNTPIFKSIFDWKRFLRGIGPTHAMETYVIWITDNTYSQWNEDEVFSLTD